MSRNQKDETLEQTKRLMGALARMPPKPHEEMKLGIGPKRKIKRATRKPRQKSK